MKIALDWAHKEDRIAVFDGKKIHKRVPKLKKGDSVYTTNLPSRYAQKWLTDDILIYRCRPNDIANFRKQLDIPKTDELDATIIWRLSEEQPEKFRRWTGDPVLITLYRSFKEIQQSRIRQSNRVWAKNEPIAKEILDDLFKLEKKILKAIEPEVEKYPIWQWLKQIKGIGPATAAGLIGPIDKLGIENFNSASSLNHYCGLHIVDGRAAKLERGKALDWNPQMRSLLIGIVGPNFLKQHTPLYCDIYYREKERQLAIEYPLGELAAKYKGYKESDTHLTKGHAHNRALRKMVKLFLSHSWEVWRRMEGLPIREPYAIEYLGHTTYIEPPFMPEELK